MRHANVSRLWTCDDKTNLLNVLQETQQYITAVTT